MRILLVALIALAVGATVVDLTSKNIQNITQIKFKKCCPHHPNKLQQAWFVIFHEQNCDNCKEASAILHNLAEQYSINETIRFGSVDWYNIAYAAIGNKNSANPLSFTDFPHFCCSLAMGRPIGSRDTEISPTS